MLKPLLLEELTIEQKVGQMLMARPPINQADREFVLEMLRNKSLGGIQVGDRILKRTGGEHNSDLGPMDIRQEIKEMQDAAGYPVLICEDMESGCPFGSVEIPLCNAIAATGDEWYAYECAKATAVEAKEIGFNLIYGPVLDIELNLNAAYVGPRTYGSKKEMVARYAAEAVKGYQEQGVLATGKHFPGYGESHVDAHMGMVKLSGDRESLLARELYPYQYAMDEADIACIMTGHIMVPAIDDTYPAVLSEKLVALIREMGFDGLIMTDSFAMVGLTNYFSLEECHKLAMKAGNDMVMTSYRISTKEAYEYMLNGYREGYITEAQIDRAVAHVIAAQNKTLKQPTQTEVTDTDKKIIEDVAKYSITACVNGVESPSVDPEGKHLFIVQEPNVFPHPETGEIYKEHFSIQKAADYARKVFTNSQFLTVSEFPSRFQYEYIMKESMAYDSVIMLTFNQLTSYIGSADYTRRMLSIMESLDHKLQAVVLIGNPAAGRELPEIPRIIYGYNKGECQVYAIKALSGEFVPQGKLPIEFEKMGVQR